MEAAKVGDNDQLAEPLIRVFPDHFKRYYDRKLATPARGRVDLHFPVEKVGPGDDIAESHPFFIVGGIKTDPIVGNDQEDIFRIGLQLDLQVGRMRMPDNIIHLFLGDPVKHELQVGGYIILVEIRMLKIDTESVGPFQRIA